MLVRYTVLIHGPGVFQTTLWDQYYSTLQSVPLKTWNLAQLEPNHGITT